MKRLQVIYFGSLGVCGAGLLLATGAQSQPQSSALVALQASSPGTAQIGNLNISGKAIFGNGAKTTSVQLTTGAGAGKLLQSDASGNATWQSFSGGIVLPYAGSTSTTGTAFSVNNTGATGTAYAIFGQVASTTAGASALRGLSTSASGVGYGVSGHSNSTTGVGVYGNAGATSGFGNFNSTAGVWGDASVGNGVLGTGGSGTGVAGVSTSGFGVYGGSNTSNGGFFTSGGAGGTGISGQADNGGGATGVYGGSLSGIGVWGQGVVYGVYGSTTGPGPGVSGSGSFGAGVVGSSTHSDGVVGSSYTAGTYGVHGTSTATGVRGDTTQAGQIGVYGYSAANSVGVQGTSEQGDGVAGRTNAASRSGVFGYALQASSVGGFFLNGGGGIALKVSGTAQVSILEITGGSDLAERFRSNETIAAGTVVAIDADHPGAICVCHGAYNRQVAGVVSGAGKLDAGVVLGKSERGQASAQVALTGRVWVQCVAGENGIEPGDLMTTSEKAGCATAVVDYDRARGAVLGKAMSRLAKGTSGLVLVLVTLQ